MRNRFSEIFRKRLRKNHEIIAALTYIERKCGVLPFAVALLLTVKNQIVHIRHAVVQHHAVCLLSCKSEHSIPQMFGIFNKKNIMNL